MNITKDGLTAVMEQIHTDRDIVTSAKIRAETSERRKTVKLRPIAAVLCAVILMCGATVSAVTLGWTEQLFGESAELIGENIDNYKVEIGNVTIENAEGVSCKFTMGDVISDGETLYFYLLAENLENKYLKTEYDSKYNSYYNFMGEAVPVNYIYPKSTDGYFRSSVWDILNTDGNTAETAVNINLSRNIRKGDLFEVELTENGTLLAMISFDIQSDIHDMSKTINVNKTAKFLGSELNGEKYSVDLNIKEVSISPLKYVIKGTSANNVNDFAFSSEGNVFIIFKNGERVEYQPTLSGEEHLDDHTDVEIRLFFDEVLDLDTVEAIEIGGITVDI